MGKHRRLVPRMPWKAENRAYLVRKYGQHAYESGDIVKLVWQDALAREMATSMYDQFIGHGDDSLRV